MRIILNNIITLPDEHGQIIPALKKQLTLPNPTWQENNRRGRWNRGVPETLSFYCETEEGLTIPRGYMRQLINICRYFNTEFTIEDKRRKLDEVEFQFNATLKPFQKTACDLMLKKQFGVLTAPTGAGKTVMMLYLIAQRKQPALIVVHTKDLAMQWVNRISAFLGIPDNETGFIGGGKFKIGGKITVAMVQSLYKRAEEIAPHIGYIAVDECHRAPSRTFHEAVTAFDAYYMTGLSATPWRRDKLSKLIFWYLGDQAASVDKKELISRGDILEAEIIFRLTSFYSDTDASLYYTRLMGELTEDEERNNLIAADVATETAASQGVCLVLSDRKAHCETIHTLLKQKHAIDSDLLTGDLKPAQRKEVLERLDSGETRVLVATSQLIGEGFDAASLSTLFLIYPIRFSGRLLQYLGRVLRPGPGKKRARVFDYVDVNIGVLEAAAKARQGVYNSDGSGISTHQESGTDGHTP